MEIQTVMDLEVTHLKIENHAAESLFPSLSLQVNAGEIVTLMGPSGCGKSTVLTAIAGHYIAGFHYSGEVKLGKRFLNNVTPEKRQIGMLFQDDLLFPHLNIWENLALALPNSVKGKQARYDAALAALENVNLADLSHNAPSQLSGGQRARISMVRMLLAKPCAVLLDEPFSKLDKALRSEFRDWVFELTKASNLPVLMVTHDSDDIPEGSRCLVWPWTSASPTKEHSN